MNLIEATEQHVEKLRSRFKSERNEEKRQAITRQANYLKSLVEAHKAKQPANLQPDNDKK